MGLIVANLLSCSSSDHPQPLGLENVGGTGGHAGTGGGSGSGGSGGAGGVSGSGGSGGAGGVSGSGGSGGTGGVSGSGGSGGTGGGSGSGGSGGGSGSCSEDGFANLTGTNQYFARHAGQDITVSICFSKPASAGAYYKLQVNDTQHNIIFSRDLGTSAGVADVSLPTSTWARGWYGICASETVSGTLYCGSGVVGNINVDVLPSSSSAPDMLYLPDDSSLVYPSSGFIWRTPLEGGPADHFPRGTGAPPFNVFRTDQLSDGSLLLSADDGIYRVSTIDDFENRVRLVASQPASYWTVPIVVESQGRLFSVLREQFQDNAHLYTAALTGADNGEYLGEIRRFWLPGMSPSVWVAPQADKLVVMRAAAAFTDADIDVIDTSGAVLTNITHKGRQLSVRGDRIIYTEEDPPAGTFSEKILSQPFAGATPVYLDHTPNGNYSVSQGTGLNAAWFPIQTWLDEDHFFTYDKAATSIVTVDMSTGARSAPYYSLSNPQPYTEPDPLYPSCTLVAGRHLIFHQQTAYTTSKLVHLDLQDSSATDIVSVDSLAAYYRVVDDNRLLVGAYAGGEGYSGTDVYDLYMYRFDTRTKVPLGIQAGNRASGRPDVLVAENGTMLFWLNTEHELWRASIDGSNPVKIDGAEVRGWFREGDLTPLIWPAPSAYPVKLIGNTALYYYAGNSPNGLIAVYWK